MSKKILQNKVQQYRKGAGDTQQQLAEAVGITRQTVIAIEKGNYTPSVDLAFRLSAYFSCSVEELFYYA
ncbi:MAG: putative transcriptional regulator [Planctomycetota bacterium]|jgi:putative transcriptional regulator